MSRRVMVFALLGCVLAGAALFAPSADSQAQPAQTGQANQGERVEFTDEEIAEGVFRTAFGAEMNGAASVDTIRKFVAPVRVYAAMHASPDRRAELTHIIADIGRHIRGLDIAMTDDPAAANLRVALVSDAGLEPALRRRFGQKEARRIVRDLQPQCLSGLTKNERHEIVRSEVWLVVDRSDFIFRDCAYEEILQAMGPINDDPTLTNSMFNDDVQMGYFDVFDQYILNVIYHPRVTPGMTRAQLAVLLPQILPEIRAFIAAVNGLPMTPNQ